MKQHPLSAAFPAMAADEFQALVDSVTNNGVINPITTYEGMVLDGWHRFNAANEAGVQCPMVELGDVDPQAFVIAQNKDRRHIAQGQIALAVASVYQWKPAHREKVAPGATLTKTNAELAEIAGTSERTIRQAKAVESKATPKVKEAVKAGEISVKRGAEIAKLPAKEQAEALTAPKVKDEEVYDPTADQLAEADSTIAELASENEELRDRLAVGVMVGTEEEKAEAAKTIADLRAQVKTLEAEAIALRSSRDHYQREASELRKQIKMNERELKKARAAA
jgi:hypothetical protein